MRSLKQQRTGRVYSRNTNMAKITTIKQRIKTIKTGIASLGTERIRGWKLMKIRDRIMLRDNYTCWKCGRVTTNGQVDHVIPLFLGGPESDENRQYLCCECHQEKTAEEGKGRK
ncbi:MAG: HNH endonuclease [Smithella sp.]